jgi:DGQHR domain-containing protein
MLPKQSELELPLLRALDELGGKAKPPELYPHLQENFEEITGADLEATLPSGANKWRNRVAWVRQKLILQGEMESLSRGVWAITSLGRQRLNSPTEYKAALRGGDTKKHSSTLKFVDSLLPATSTSVIKEARGRKGLTGDGPRDYENSVWKLIYSLTPSAITIGRDPAVRLPTDTFRPDMLALFEETRFLLAECKLTSSSAYLTNWLTEFRHVRRELEDALKKSGYLQFVYVLFVRSKSDVEDHVHAEAEALRVRIVDEREVQYFDALQKQSGIGISPIFWSRVAPFLVRNEEIRLPALRIKRKSKQEAYIFSMNAHDLLNRCFVSHRALHSPEEGEIGFQRMLQKKKLNEVTKYIKEKQVFPTPIVVAFRRKPSPVFEPLPITQKAVATMRDAIEFGYLRLPRDVNSIQVIDGQHRLYGYSRLPKSDGHIVHVLAYRDEGESLATMFVDINSKQTKVPASLLWELYPDIYGEGDPEFWKAEISGAVEVASHRQLNGLVEQLSTGTHGPISFQTLCSEVKRAGLLEELGSRGNLQNGLEALFATTQELGDLYPNVNNAFLFTNNSFSAVIRTAGRILKFEVANNRRDNLKKRASLQETFRRYLEPVYRSYGALDDARLRGMRKRSGNSGINQTEDEIAEAIRNGYMHGFPYRAKKIPPDWQEAVDKCTTLILSINREASDSGRSSGWVFRDFDPERFKKALGKPIDGQDAFGTVLSQLYKDVYEGSGKDGPDNRVKNFLKLTSISDLDPIRKLNALRTCWEHNPTQIDPRKKQKAMAAMEELSGRAPLTSVGELDRSEWQRAACALLVGINKQILEELRSAIASL